MNTYWVDFSGYCQIKANSKEEAKEIFWSNLPAVGENDVWDIDCVEECEEN